MKKLLVCALALVMIASMVACENKSEQPIINDNYDSQQDSSSEEKTTDVAEEEIYNDKIYYVDEDISEGKYIVNCTKSKYGMDVIVFKSEIEYQSFQNSEQFTTGEYRKAVEKNAWESLYIKEDEKAYISLEKGNVLLLDEGMCEFNKYDALDSNKLYSGIYVVGKDIKSGRVDIKCISNSLEVVVFESDQKYSEYHKTSRFTVGEESDAVEKYSMDNDYIYNNDSKSVDLKDGMILMVDNGVGEYSFDKGPIIN